MIVNRSFRQFIASALTRKEWVNSVKHGNGVICIKRSLIAFNLIQQLTPNITGQVAAIVAFE